MNHAAATAGVPSRKNKVKNHFTAFAVNPASYRYIDGVKVCDDFRDCGHQHRSVEAAQACLDKLAATGSTDWINTEIRDGDGIPVVEPEIGQILQWQKDWREGKLSDWQIKRIEKIPGWSWRK